MTGPSSCLEFVKIPGQLTIFIFGVTIKALEVNWMQTVKQEVGNLINNLPDDCSYEDIQYHLYVLQKIKKGLSDAEQGNVMSQEEIEKRMEKWTKA